MCGAYGAVHLQPNERYEWLLEQIRKGEQIRLYRKSAGVLLNKYPGLSRNALDEATQEGCVKEINRYLDAIGEGVSRLDVSAYKKKIKNMAKAYGVPVRGLEDALLKGREEKKERKKAGQGKDG